MLDICELKDDTEDGSAPGRPPAVVVEEDEWEDGGFKEKGDAGGGS